MYCWGHLLSKKTNLKARNGKVSRFLTQSMSWPGGHIKGRAKCWVMCYFRIALAMKIMCWAVKDGKYILHFQSACFSDTSISTLFFIQGELTAFEYSMYYLCRMPFPFWRLSTCYLIRYKKHRKKVGLGTQRGFCLGSATPAWLWLW